VVRRDQSLSTLLGSQSAERDWSVPGARDFLQRFRPVGTPGAATVSGVPADRVVEVTAELEPVFAALEDVAADAARIRAAADDEAARRRERGVEQAAAVVAAARRQAEADRAEGMARARREAEAGAAAVVADAHREATAGSRRAEQGHAALVEQVVTGVRAALAASPDAAREPAP
jgi:hypothetical protein